MKKWKIIILAVVAIVTIASLTLTMSKPDRNAHYQTIKTEVAQVVSRELGSNPLFSDYAINGTMKVLEFTDELLTRGLIIHDHTFYNIGYLIYNGTPYPVTIGILGQVHLTLPETELQQLMKHL